MRIAAVFCYLLLAAMPACPGLARAQSGSDSDATLHIVKSSINADADNAELCLEFDKPLAATNPARLAAALKLESAGKPFVPQNIDSAGAALCLFPLERHVAYQLSVSGLRGANDEKMAAPYTMSFAIPDRMPHLAFTGTGGGVNGFGSYDTPLTLRAVNVAQVDLAVYRLDDLAAQTRAWQDRAQTALAPSESAYLARSKGHQVWRNENQFDAPRNAAVGQSIDLRERLPDLPPGLYLIVAAAAGADDTAKAASKGLAPLAAAWFTKSDFSLRAIRDSAGIHVFADATGKGKSDLRLIAMNRKPDQLAEATADSNGAGLIAVPPHAGDGDDGVTVVGVDAAGNIAFADVASLPPLTGLGAAGAIHADGLFAVPGEPVDLTLAASGEAHDLTAPSLLRLSRGNSLYADFPVTAGNADLSFIAPAAPGAWAMRWQKQDGDALAESPLRVTANADAPRLVVTSQTDSLNGDAAWPVTVQSLASSGQPVALIGGRISVAWQRIDAAAAGWKDYRFGVPAAVADAPVTIAHFLTDLQGTAVARLALPPRPQDPGLYQAALTAVAQADSGVEDARPLILPLRPDEMVVGIKPMAAAARFAQNGIARFTLIALASDGKPRDSAGLSYQIYEEGRSFAWYQDQGRWTYKPEPRLRPIGGGALQIKADGGTVLEWPVTAGNYRLQILDAGGKKLAETGFSAGWDSAGATVAATPLGIGMDKILRPGVPATAHVMLPQAAMMTVLIADSRIRQIIREFRPRGDNEIVFTPAADWQNGISVTVDAIPQDGQNPPLHGQAEATVAPEHVPAPDAGGGLSIAAMQTPAGVMLRSGGAATLMVALENRASGDETYRYAFSAGTGLKISGGESGSVTVGGKQSRSLAVTLSGESAGVRDLRLEVIGTHTPRVARSWPVAVLPKENFLRGGETVAIAPRQAIAPSPAKGREAPVVFIARRPMDGLPEILSYVFDAHPFTTVELARGVDALRLWGDTLAQSGLAPDIAAAARRRQWLLQLLRHQNADGGFAALRGGDSTMEDTAAALTALGPDASALAAPPRALATAWIKQRLANTWFDAKERAPRAAGYAALAAADAIDAASLHYFSDTSANDEMTAVADADMAAAFKHIRDPAASAFWIKKMLDENKQPPNLDVLNALAATDALSSDAVHAAMRGMADALRRGDMPDIADAAALLRAIAADNADAGDWRLATGGQSRNVSGVLTLRLPDPAAATLRSGEAQPLSATYAWPVERSAIAAVTRHIYRLNGVELTPHTRPARGEIYVVEVKGTAPTVADGMRLALHDGSNAALRPMTCPLSAKGGAPSFMPWFSAHDLTPVSHCELTPYEMNVVLERADNGKSAFSAVYFARIDAASAGALAAPEVRVIR